MLHSVHCYCNVIVLVVTVLYLKLFICQLLNFNSKFIEFKKFKSSTLQMSGELDHDEELAYDHVPMELMGDIEPHVSRNAMNMAGLQVSGSEFSSEIGEEEAPEYVNQLDKNSIRSYSRTPPASYVSERSWTCPTPKCIEKVLFIAKYLVVGPDHLPCMSRSYACELQIY